MKTVLQQRSEPGRIRSDIAKFVVLCVALIFIPLKAAASPCTPISLGAAPKTGAISSAGETDCFTFTGAAGDVMRVRLIKTSGTFNPFAQVFRPNGTLCAQGFTGEFNCAVNSAGKHTILVNDFSPGTRTGTYRININKL